MKKYLALCLSLCISVLANAQATDLVVDCQAPGWLSSKINYGDQQTVKNLKVTGYINSDDLKFIGQLIQAQSLTGRIDLSDADVVGNNMGPDAFSLTSTPAEMVKRLDLPITLEIIEDCLHCHKGSKIVGLSYDYYLYTDTLFFNPKNINYISSGFFGACPQNIIIGENVDSIPGQNIVNNTTSIGFCGAEKLKSMKLSLNMKYIGDCAFYGSGLEKINLEEANNIEYIGAHAFRGSSYTPDTLYIPSKITELNASSFSYKDGQHIFIPKSVINIKSELANYGKVTVGFGNALIFHMESATPPQGHAPNKTCVVYVPKGSKQAYLNSSWKNATIIELNPVEAITLNEHQLTMNKKDQFSLSVTITPEDADDKTIAWTSEDESIATVNENGVVTAVKEGQTKIYAKSVATGIQDFCTVLVRKNVTGISLNEAQITFSNIADTKQLVATVLPEDATDKSVTWSSSNEQVCKVSAAGLVTATGIGSTLITATTVDGGLTANCVVKVLQHVDGLTLNKTDLSLKVGESEKLQPTITPSNADNKKVIWTSSDSNVATVDTEGNVTAVKAGQVTITATSEDNTEAKATCTVTVIQPVTGISLSESSYKLKAIGENIQLTATVLPEDATNKKVNWNCPNNTVCIVSNGNVVAIGYGTAVIIATTEDGGFIATCTVIVEDTSGIIEVKSDHNDNLPTYDTMGRKVQELKKGQLYIRQGKKFVAK